MLTGTGGAAMPVEEVNVTTFGHLGENVTAEKGDRRHQSRWNV